MKRKRFTSLQITKIMQEHEAGKGAVEISKEYSISLSSFYKWRNRYKNATGTEISRLKQLEHENALLQAKCAALTKDLELAKEIIEKKL